MSEDTISRQAVLKLLAALPPEEATTKALLIQSVKQMDAAQPSGPDNLVKDSQGLAKDLVNDFISRKAAIERATKDHDFYKGATTPADMARRDELLNVMCWLGELPPAQPNLQPSCNQLATDYISRQAAIDALHMHLMYRMGTDSNKKRLDDWINSLPSAQPEPIRLWLDHELSKEEYERLKKDCAEQPIILFPKESAQQWIPCSERLPEHGGRYLISVLDGINRRTTVAPYLPRCKAWAMNGRMAYWKVIAWMPLPEPLKEDDHEIAR